MRQYGHGRMGPLKLDGEGAEERVNDTAIEDRLDVGILYVEPDGTQPPPDRGFPGRTRRWLSRLFATRGIASRPCR